MRIGVNGAAGLAGAWAGVAFVVLLATGGAQAQTVRAEAPALAEILRERNFAARVGVDADGDPKISSGSQGVKWDVFFYGCTNNFNCTSVQFSTALIKKNVSLGRLNDWNARKRFAKANLDVDGDVELKLDVMLRSGVSRSAFEASLDLWDSQLGDFLNHIGWGR